MSDQAGVGLRPPVRGDLVVSGYGLVHTMKDVLCEHLVVVDGYYEKLTRIDTLEFAGYVAVWRKKTDRCGRDGVPAGGSLNLVRP